MTTDALADSSDVQRLWRPFGPAFTPEQDDAVEGLIRDATAKLRHAVPFDVDARIANYAAVPRANPALDPQVVANVVATIVKRFLTNIEGYASTSQSMGPYSQSVSFVSRFGNDKSHSDVRGALEVTDADIDQLRPAVPRRLPVSVQTVPTRAMLPRSGFLRPGDREGWRGDELVDGFPLRASTGLPVGNGPDPDDELL